MKKDANRSGSFFFTPITTEGPIQVHVQDWVGSKKKSYIIDEHVGDCDNRGITLATFIPFKHGAFSVMTHYRNPVEFSSKETCRCPRCKKFKI